MPKFPSTAVSPPFCREHTRSRQANSLSVQKYSVPSTEPAGIRTHPCLAETDTPSSSSLSRNQEKLGLKHGYLLWSFIQFLKCPNTSCSETVNNWICSQNCLWLLILLQSPFSPCPQATLRVPSQTLAKCLYRQGHFVLL